MSNKLEELFSPKAITGKGSIVVEVIADSINQWGDRLTTFRLHYPRLVHQELMTHRMFSRNASSSRAIPVNRVLDQVTMSPAKPVEWGKNQAGMQSAGGHDALVNGIPPDDAWQLAAMDAATHAQGFSDAGYHKQVANRLTEPFQFINTLVTATDFNNFFWLRCHKDADPTIKALADLMSEAYSKSEPELLKTVAWHTPYVDHVVNDNGDVEYRSDGSEVSLDEAIAISSSCCAQVSYRRLDTSQEKAESIFDKLVTMEPLHASPFEHVARPISFKHHNKCSLAADLIGEQAYYIGNFRGFVQYRKTLTNECNNKPFSQQGD